MNLFSFLFPNNALTDPLANTQLLQFHWVPIHSAININIKQTNLCQEYTCIRHITIYILHNINLGRCFYLSSAVANTTKIFTYRYPENISPIWKKSSFKTTGEFRHCFPPSTSQWQSCVYFSYRWWTVSIRRMRRAQRSRWRCWTVIPSAKWRRRSWTPSTRMSHTPIA